MLSSLSMFVNFQGRLLRVLGDLFAGGHLPHGININVINLDSGSKSSKNTKEQY